MLLPIVLLTILTCVAGDNSEPLTLDGLLDQYCSAIGDTKEEDASPVTIRGQFGPRGFRGPTGEPGRNGTTGRPGLMNDTVIREFFLENLDSVFRFMNWSAFLGVRLESCEDVKERLSPLPHVTSGIFNIYQPTIGWVDVNCNLDVQEQQREQEGNWTVFQRRIDGSVDFFRGWNDYVNGFGDRNQEFWLGLEEIHRLTHSGEHELKIDMISDNGTYVTAKYSYFKIGPASDNYRLHVRGYSGNATDALAYPSDACAVHNGQQFSTKDADHDQDTANCANAWKGAWWYKNCYYSNLNGVYNFTNFQGIVWRETDDRRMYMRFTEMKFRRVPTTSRISN